MAMEINKIPTSVKKRVLNIILEIRDLNPKTANKKFAGLTQDEYDILKSEYVNKKADRGSYTVREYYAIKEVALEKVWNASIGKCI